MLGSDPRASWRRATGLGAVATPEGRSAALTLILLGAAGVAVSPDLLAAPLAEGNLLLFALDLVLLPLGLACFAFPVLHLVRSLSSLYGSLRPALEGSRYLACAPRAALPPGAWPAVTVQVPVYCESFAEVIRPTLERALIAAKGHARIVVYDDGLAVLADDDLPGVERRLASKRHRGEPLTAAEHEIAARLAFYRVHRLGFVARSRHGRAGRFKKASNLNVGMNLADAVERRLASLPAAARAGAYPDALRAALAEQPRPVWAEGDIRLGEVLVLLDKDSEIPEGIIGATVPEFLDDASLAFTQHRTRVVNGCEGFFARWLGRFTESLFFVSFPLVAAAGGPPPLVGHNAFLRTAALRAVARRDGSWTQYWEDVVSEDLELALRLESAGWIGRYVAFPGLDFGERVTRTYAEEARRFRKFAFGAAEVLVNPIPEMASRGVLTPTFRRFLAAPHVPWPHKLGVVAYCMSYLALAFPLWAFPALALALALDGPVRWATFSSIWTVAVGMFVFVLVSGMVCQHVRNELAAGGAGIAPETTASAVRTSLFAFGLFSALSWPAGSGIAHHLFSRRLQFGATNLDRLESGRFLHLVIDIWREHAQQIVTAVAVLGAVAFTYAWHGFAIIAASHILMPVVLNPHLVARLERTPIPLLARGSGAPEAAR